MSHSVRSMIQDARTGKVPSNEYKPNRNFVHERYNTKDIPSLKTSEVASQRIK